MKRRRKLTKRQFVRRERAASMAVTVRRMEGRYGRRR